MIPDRPRPREHRLSAQKTAILNAAHRCPECGKWITADKYMRAPHIHGKEKSNGENQDDQAGVLGFS